MGMMDAFNDASGKLNFGGGDRTVCNLVFERMD